MSVFITFAENPRWEFCERFAISSFPSTKLSISKAYTLFTGANLCRFHSVFCLKLSFQQGWIAFHFPGFEPEVS